MDHYYVNNNALPTGEHSIHKKDCTYFPTERIYLGQFSNFDEALEKAKTFFDNIESCKFCQQPVSIK